MNVYTLLTGSRVLIRVQVNCTLNARAYLKSTIGDRELSVLSGLSSISLSRRDKVFRTWMLLKAHGKEKYKQLVQQNLDDINYLVELIENEPVLELTARAPAIFGE